MTDDLDLLERARETRWERDLVPAQEIRARANRRTQARWGMGGIGGCVSLVVALAAAGSLGHNEPDRVATETIDSSNTMDLLGAEFRLPPGWHVLDRSTLGEVCVGPPTEPAARCPIRVAVASNPKTAPENGLDVVSDLMNPCRPGDAQLVEVRHDQLGTRQTSTYTGRCTSESPAMTAWALDNRAMYLIAADPQWRPDGEAIFNTASVPGSWPQNPTAPPSELPEEAQPH